MRSFLLIFIFVGVLFVSGCDDNLLNSFSALTTTVYGNVLLTKVCLVSLLLSLGALNKFRLLPFLRTNERAGAKNFTFPYNLKSYSSF
jgi:putative copper export protein